MERIGLDVLVPPEGVWIGPCVEQCLRGLDVPVEAGQGERLKAVVAVRVGEACIAGDELAEPVGAAQGCGFEHVELGALGEHCLDLVGLAAVECFEQLGHTASATAGRAAGP